MYKEPEFQVSAPYLIPFPSSDFFTHLCHCVSFIKLMRKGEEDALVYSLNNWRQSHSTE